MAVLPPVEFGVKISRPPEEVFAYLQKWDRQFEWLEGIAEARFLTPGFGVGTVCRKIRRTPQGPETFDVKIRALDHYALWWEDEVADGPNRGSRWRWRVQRDGTGSTVLVDVEVHTSGLRGLAKGSARIVLETEMKASLDRLKKKLEVPAPR
jgi:hypothetical protein